MTDVAPAIKKKYHGDRPAVSDSVNILTFDQLHAAIDRCARALMEWKFPDASPAAIVCESSVAYPVMYFGCQRAGLVSVPMDGKRPQVDMLQMMRELHVRALLCNAAQRPMIQYLVDRLDYKLFAGVVFPDGRLEQVIQGETGPPVQWSASERVEAVAYSAGTTENPHGIIQTTRRLQTARRSWMDALSLQDDDRLLVALPVCNPGLQCGLMHTALTSGNQICFTQPHDDEQLLQNLERMKPTILFGLPGMFARLNAWHEDDRLRTLTARFCVSTGSPLPTEVTEIFEQRFGIPLLNIYGTVGSAGAAIATHVDQEFRPGNMGLPLKDVTVEIVRADDTLVANGEVGEIRLSGPHVTNWRAAGGRPEEDPWLYTGDLAYVNDAGYMTFACRRTDVINKGGFPVFPQEVEAIIMTHPAVSDVAVVGIPDDDRIEELKGFVVVKQGNDLREKELIGYCSERLPKYQCPRFVQFVASLPKNYLDQVLRKDLRKLTQISVQNQ